MARAYSQDLRRRVLTATAGALGRSTFAPRAGALAARLGCIYKEGRWRCGTY